MFPCSHETTFIYVCMEVCVFMSYLEVFEHFWAHNLKWLILRETHLYNNLLLWPKTMYGQTNAWVLPNGWYYALTLSFGTH
jgi:hypothetical protein